MNGLRHRPRHLTAALTLALASLAALLAPLGAAAATSPTTLSPRLAVLASPPVRGLASAAQSRRVGLAAHGTGSLLRHGRRVLVDVHFGSDTAERLDALRATGARVVAVSPRYEAVTVAALPAQLRALGSLGGVLAVSEVIAPLTHAVCPSGSVVSEGDGQLEAAAARGDFGVDGSGVTVGVLSDSFNQAVGLATSERGDVATGDLPGPSNPCGQKRAVDQLIPLIPGAAAAEEGEEENEEEEGGTDEGRAMVQIVHDLAPGADIDFASAYNGEFAFANAIRALHAAGAQVIGDDIGYFDEPFFQDGPVAVAVNEVTAAGANYFSAAGNENFFDEEGNEIGSWEAPEFRETACPAALPAPYETCMDFNPAAGKDSSMGITIEEEEALYVDLQWAQPWNGVTTDLDMFLVKEGEIVGEAFNNANTEPGRQEPYEFIPYEEHEEEGSPEEEVELVIARCDVKCGEGRAEEEVDGVKPLEGTKGGDDGTPRLKVVLIGDSALQYPETKGGDVTGPTVFGHPGAASAIAAGAINYATKAEPEYYSSRGPVTHYFGPVTGTAAAAPTPAEVIPKPNVTATDCGRTTFFYSFREGGYRFCGTSAATPHAEAIAALIRSANPGVTNAQVRADMEATALPIGEFGPEAIGAGLLDADAAVAALALPPTVTVRTPPAAVGKEKRPSIAFDANRPVRFVCTLDGSVPSACASPFVPAANLAEGSHTFTVTGTDIAGRSGTASAKFSIDTKAPSARVAKHPKKLVKTHRKAVALSFGFASDDKSATFRCRIDKGKFKTCKAKISRRFRKGGHSVAVRAVDAAGNVGKPATFKFRVKHVRHR